MRHLEDVIAQLTPGGRDVWRYSEWLEIDQRRISGFGHITNDPDPLHIDPDYAREFGPYGVTIAFGFLTVSLLTFFHHQATPPVASGYALNYGFDRLRLTSTVKVGARVRGAFRLIDAQDRGAGRLLLRYETRVEVEGDDKPALVAEWLVMWIDDGRERPADLALATATAEA